MTLAPMPGNAVASVAVAIDSSISFSRFASAIGQAGLKLRMRDGVLSVLDGPAPLTSARKRRTKQASAKASAKTVVSKSRRAAVLA
jgi:hypothetical protein